MSKTPLKKIIKSKIRTNKELTPQEKMREKIKYEIAEELGLSQKVDECDGEDLHLKKLVELEESWQREKKN